MTKYTLQSVLELLRGVLHRCKHLVWNNNHFVHLFQVSKHTYFLKFTFMLPAALEELIYEVTFLHQFDSTIISSCIRVEYCTSLTQKPGLDWTLQRAKGQAKFVCFIISKFFSIYFTITGVKKIVPYAEDFVTQSFVKLQFHCIHGCPRDELKGFWQCSVLLLMGDQEILYQRYKNGTLEIQSMAYSLTLLYRPLLNTDTSLIWTVYFVLGERKPLH